MKILKYLFLIMMIYTICFTSCKKLELTPEDYFSASSYWKSDVQFETYVTGLHRYMRNFYETNFLLGEVRGGTQSVGTQAQGGSVERSSPFKDNLFTQANTGLTRWADYYPTILRINLFIQKAEETTLLTPDKKNYYLAQAYGMRSFLYFMLYRTYGGLPLVSAAKAYKSSDAIMLSTPRSTPKQTLDFIKADVNKSEEMFATDNFTQPYNSKGYWSKAATLMLKSEIYLWSAKVTTDDQSPTDIQGDAVKAETALTQIMNSGKYALVPKFTDIFPPTNKNNKEIIYCYTFQESDAEMDFIGRFRYNFNFPGGWTDSTGTIVMQDTLNIRGNKSSPLYYEYKWSLFTSYDDADVRKRGTFLDYYKLANGVIIIRGVLLRKFNGSINSTGSLINDNDYPVYRYADLILMLAEIENLKGGDPAKYINQIRQRAYGASYPVYANSSYAENELAILKERDKEFVAESKRWFDIRRMHDAGKAPLVFSPLAAYPVGGAPVLSKSDVHKLLWPIDVGTLNQDPALGLQAQNPGY